MNDFKEAASPRHDMIDARINSQRGTTCTRPAQVQASQNSSTKKWEVDTKILLLTKKLCVIGIHRERERQFSPVDCHWAYNTLQGRLHSLANTNQTPWFVFIFCFALFKREIEVAQIEDCVFVKKYDQHLLHGKFKNNKNYAWIHGFGSD